MKLLNKSLKAYLLYSAIVLVVSIPAFYFEIKSIVAEDIDEDLLAKKADMLSRIKIPVTQSSLEFYESLEPDFSLKPTAGPYRRDSFYTVTVYDPVSKENVPHRVLETMFELSGNAYDIKIRTSLVDNDELIFTIVTVQAILVLFIVAGLLAITRYNSKKLWKPFYSTLKRLHEYRMEGSENLNLENSPIDEFADLNTTITNLTNRNKQVFLLQKEFTENASHELQTPLAVFSGKVELLMQTTPLTNEQADLISELSVAGQRMNRLNKTLLLLSQIDNNQFSGSEQVSLEHTFKKMIEQYRNALSQKKVSIQTNVVQDFFIIGNSTLVEILIGNLLSNAIRHNIQEGMINILLDSGKVCVSNSGPSNALNGERLFQRFQKQTSDTNSVGLGLEIVKRICNIYHADITYSFSDGTHSFNLFFNS